MGNDAFREERSDDADARPNYHVEQGIGAPTLFITVGCAGFR